MGLFSQKALLFALIEEYWIELPEWIERPAKVVGAERGAGAARAGRAAAARVEMMLVVFILGGGGCWV